MSALAQKTCVDCGEVKQLSDFYTNSKGSSHSRCKPCTRVRKAKRRQEDPEFRQRLVAEGVKWRRKRRATDAAFREKENLKRRARKYGIAWEDIAALRSAQENRCACCARPLLGDTKEAVDHCHATGRVRGLICMNCNTGLGHLGDTVEGLERALAYLRRSTISA